MTGIVGHSLPPFCEGIAVNAQFFAMLKMSERQQNQYFLMVLIKTQQTMIGVNGLVRRLHGIGRNSASDANHFISCVLQCRDRNHFRAIEN